MTSQTSSATGQVNWRAAALDYVKKKGRLELWSGVLAMQSLKRADREQAMNREAESRWARRKMWGESQSDAEADMHDTYLGDVHVHQQAPKAAASGLVKGLIGAGLLATGAGIPFGASLIADALKGAAPNFTDTDTDTTIIGLEKEPVE